MSYRPDFSIIFKNCTLRSALPLLSITLPPILTQFFALLLQPLKTKLITNTTASLQTLAYFSNPVILTTYIDAV
jgi:hypothetical protein